MALASGVNVLSGSGSVAMVSLRDVETNAGGSYDVAWALATRCRVAPGKEVRPALDTAGSDARIPAPDSDRRPTEGVGGGHIDADLDSSRPGRRHGPARARGRRRAGDGARQGHARHRSRHAGRHGDG